jgi:2'-5' RNA ligase
MNFEAPLLVVVATPDPVPGYVDRSQWPVHVTVAPNFSVDETSQRDVITLLEASARDAVPFEVALGSGARFGIAADVPVLLAPHPSLARLHEELAAGLAELRGFFAVEADYWGEGYRPHVTLGSAVQASEGDVLAIRMLTLVLLQQQTTTRIAAFELP